MSSQEVVSEPKAKHAINKLIIDVLFIIVNSKLSIVILLQVDGKTNVETASAGQEACVDTLIERTVAA